MGFTKLDERILQSSIMAEHPNTFKVWIALMAACKENSIAYVAPTYLAKICHMKKETIYKALDKLSSPDVDSRSKKDRGRRIRRVDGGWKLINYPVYREKTLQDAEAERKRLYRERIRKSPCPGLSRTRPDTSASVSASDIPSSSSKRGKGGEDEGFINFWANYVRKVGKEDALSAWKNIPKNEQAAVIVATINYTRDCAKKKTEIQYIKHPATFLRRERWKDYAVEGEGALAGVTGHEGCQYVAPTAEDQEAEKKIRAEYDERLKAFMKERGYKTEEEIPIDIETFFEFKKRMAKEGK